MTERELILLGFKSEEIKEHDEDDSYYYVLDIVDGLTFITPTNEEIKDDKKKIKIKKWNKTVEFYKGH